MKTAKRALALLLSLMLVLGTAAAGGVSVSALSGSGTADDPYQIESYSDLNEFADIVNGTDEVAPNPSACAVLTANIECKNNPDDEEYAKDWVPIAKDEDYPFTGTFDGKGHKITGLDNSGSGKREETGLFGYIGEGGTVKNVRLENANLSGEYISGIAHENRGTISGCSFGGIIACGGCAGGIAGSNFGTISNCYNTGNVSGESPVGGIAGLNSGEGKTVNCYNTGNVSGIDYVGGILGSNYNDGALTNSYNTGSVTGNNVVGGIAGFMNKNNPSWACSVTNSYNTGSVTLSGENAKQAGGVVGYNNNNCTVANCYYDSEKCTFGAIDGADDTANSVKGLTTDKMTGASALDNMPGLSLDSWLTKENADGWAYYPHLKGFAYDSVSTDENWPAKTEYTAPAVYEISNYAELVAFAVIVNGNEDEGIAPEPSACAVLTANITSTATDWVPIAKDLDYSFTGTFDGSGYKITGLDNSESDSRSEAGLFGFIGEGGTVKNLRLESADFGGNNIGGIAYENNGTISGCSFGGIIACEGYAGGIACDNYGTITDCYNTGNVTCSSCVGGIVGGSTGTVKNCYNTGNVTATGDYVYAGGVAGDNENGGKVTDCYNTGNVTATGNYAYAGGVAGYVKTRDSAWVTAITNCYSAGSVTLSGENAQYAGGVVGYNNNNCTVANCYYDSEKCSFGAIDGADDTANSVKGLSTAEMTGESALGSMTFSYDEGVTSPWLTKENADGWAYYPHLKGFAYDSVSTDANWPAKTEYTAPAQTVFEISNYEDLKEFADIVNGENGKTQNPSACAVLTADIIANDKKWVPIAKTGCAFTGTFDGSGYKITGLDNSESYDDSGDDSGLFGFIGESGSVKNVRLESANLEGANIGGIAHENNGTISGCSFGGTISCGGCVGGIVGENNGTITDCCNTGTVSGFFPVGGIAGENYGTITNCYNTGDVTGDNNVGGIAGENEGTITNCYNTGSVTGSYIVGGIVGLNTERGKTVNCYNTGNVTGDDSVGGIVGQNMNNGKVTDCYNTGNVTGNNYAGGVAGVMDTSNSTQNCSLANCYNAGAVTAQGEDDNYAGGVVGYNYNCTVENCYYDNEKCGCVKAVGNSADTNTVKGLTTAQMTGTSALGSMTFSYDEGVTSPWLTKENADGWAYYPHLKGFAYDSVSTDANWPAKIEYTAPAQTVYEISNYEELVAFAALVNGNEDEGIDPEPSACAVLTADIIANDKKWVPIAKTGCAFTGTFDGQGNTITGLDNSEADNNDYSGLFAFIGESGSVKNVRLINANFGGNNIGGIAYENNGTIQNCSFDGSVAGNSLVGGIACDNYGTVTNCYNTGSVSGNHNVGGIAGTNYGTVTNCYNTGSVSGSKEVGGITGRNTGTVANCYNTGSVSGDENVGGVLGGNFNPGALTNSYNTGSVIGNNAVGGIAGLNGGTISNCYNTGDISGNSPVGGVAGDNENTGKVTDCFNTGNIIGNNAVGGIAGYMDKNNPSWACSTTNCYNAGAVTAQGENDNYAGGVVGYNYNCTVENCYYDNEKCGCEKAVGNSADTNTVKGLTTAQMTGESALGSMTFSYDEGVTSPWLTKENADGWAYYPHLKGFNLNDNGTQLSAEEIEPENWPAKTEYTKADPLITLSVTPEQPDYGDDITITVTLPDDATEDITLTVDGTQYTMPVDGDGTATFTIPGLTPGEHGVIVSYGGDDNYNAVTEELTVKIPKYSSTVTLEISPEEPVYGDDVIIIAHLPADATGVIILTVDGIAYTVPVKDGEAVCTVGSPAPGEHTVTASYPGDDYYNEASAPGTFTVQAAVIAPTGISLDNHEINFTEGSSQVIAADIEPAGATGTVIWSSSNENAATVTDNNDGTATVTAAGVGTAVITAAIQGTDFSDSCTVRVTEYICPHTSKTEIPAKAATCTDPGNNRYYKCDDCGKYLKADGTTLTSPAEESIPAPGHNWSSEYQSDDNQHWRICTRCNDNESGTDHIFGGAIYTWAQDNSTCTAEHTCSVCGKKVSETVDATSFISKDPTCTEAGETTLKAYFTKTGFTTQTNYETIPSPGHDWGRPTYTWDEDNNYATCTARRECTRSGCGLKETETVNSSYTVTATCVEAGMIFYTASFTNAAFEAQEKEVPVDALGHNWQEVIIYEATADSLGEIQEKCSRCGDTGDSWYYLLDETSPSEYPYGGYISDWTVFAKDKVPLGDGDITVILQDPLESLYTNEFEPRDDFEIVIKSVSADLGENYDGAQQPENAYKANVVIKINGEEISGQLPGKVRLLLEIPDGWDINDVNALLINIGVDRGFVECIEYQLYGEEDNFMGTVSEDYEPSEGESVKVFAAIWTDHFSDYALVDVLTDEEAFDKYKEDAKDDIDALAKEGDSAAVGEILSGAKDDIDALLYDDGKSLEENKADVDDIVDAAGTAADEQRAADKLAAEKEAAKEELENYKNPEDYRPDQQTEFQNAISSGKDAIDNAEDSDGVAAALADAKAAIDAIKTDEQLTAEELAAAKADAKEELENYKNPGDYRPAEQTELENAVNSGKEAIDNAEDTDGVASALSDAKAAIDAIKTDADYIAEELAADKDAAKEELENYKNPEDYRPDQQTELQNAISSGKDAIDNAEDTDGVASALENAKAAIDAIKTDEQLKAEELAAAKEAAKEELENYKNPEDYRPAEQTELENAVNSGKDAIDNAEDTDGVASALSDAKAAIDAIKTDADYIAEELAADKEAFEEYKNDKKDEIDALAQEDDSDAVKEIIDSAKDGIDNLEYDESKSLEDNKAAVDAKVDETEKAVEDQREAEKLNTTVEIKDFEEQSEIGYREDVTYTADATDLPEGAEVHWFVNGEDVGTGESCTVEDPTEDYTIQAKVIDKDGNTVSESSTAKVKVRNGFFDRLKAFFAELIEKILGKAIIEILTSIC